MKDGHPEYTNDMYAWAEKCVAKKPSLAMEILMNSEDDADGKEFANWNTPSYIKEGLVWLRDN